MNVAFYKNVSENFTTTKDNTTTVNIQFEDYRNDIDLLDVYVNGIHLTENVDYVRTSNGITLTKALDKDNLVNFTIRRATSADIEDYESLRGPAGTVENVPTLIVEQIDEICV